jgi:hypothetical protein
VSRAAGETRWRDALPLLRLQSERIYAESRVDVIAKRRVSSPAVWPGPVKSAATPDGGVDPAGR